MIVLAVRLLLKCLPLIVSLAPTPIRIGATFVITGVRVFSAADAGAAVRNAVPASARRTMETGRRMPSPLSTVSAAR